MLPSVLLRFARCLPWAFVVALLVGAGAFPAGAQPEPEVVAEWRFDRPEILQTLAPANWEQIAVRDGVLQGRTRYDSMLSLPPVSLDAARIRVVGLRVRSDTSGGGELFFRRGDEPFADARCIPWEIPGDGEWHDLYVPISNPEWQGTITGLRLDPINPAAQISVAWLRLLTAAPNNRVPNGGFEEGLEPWRLTGDGTLLPRGASGRRALRLAPRARAVSAPVDFSFLGTYRLRAQTRGGAGSLSLRFRDLDGRPVGKPITLQAKASAGWAPVSLTFDTPLLAAEGTITLAGGSQATEWDAVALDEVARFPVETGPEPHRSWRASWIWHPQAGDGMTAAFRTTLNLPAGKVEHALLLVTGDDAFTLFVNGRKVAADEAVDGWRTPELVDLRRHLRPGRNVIAAKVRELQSAEGLLVEGEIRVGGRTIRVASGSAWRATLDPAPGWEQPDFDDSAWVRARSLGRPPISPWGPLEKPHLGPLTPAAVVRRQVPATIRAGSTVRLGATFRTRATGSIVAELVRGDLRVPLQPAGGWRPRRQGDLVTVGPAAVTVPEFVPGGRYRLRFAPTGTTLLGRWDGRVSGPTVTVQPRRPGPLARAEVRPYRGVPTLFLNGKPDAGMHYIHIRDVPFHVRNLAGAGVHLYVVDVLNIGWVGPDRYDYAIPDRMILSVLRHDPQAYIIPTFDLSGKAFPFWRDLVPRDEWTTTDDGQHNVGDYAGQRNEFPSLASPTWARLTHAALRRFARHLYASSFADRIVGYWPCDGISWEWFPWGAQSEEWVDYSPAYLRAFQSWLRRQYPDLAALNRAWHTQLASYDDVRLPTKAERLATDRLAFRDPAGPLRRVTDFYRFHHEEVADRIAAYARVLKEESGGRHLVGTYYGYVFYLPETPYFGPHSGHFALHRYLASPDLDFACSPTPYGHVRAVGSPSGFMTASEAFRLVGKLWVQQADIRTHWTTQPFSPTKTLRESAAVLRREFLLAFVRGHLPQWYDFSLGWIGGDPRLGRVLRELQTAARKHLDADRTAPRDTLAVVVDETNLYAQRPDRPLMGGPIGTDLRYALGQMGVPYEVFLTSDLTRPKLRRYPAYLFVNCFRLTPEQRQAIEALKSDGRVLAFVYTPGILDDEGYHPERVSSVVGQRLVLEPVEGALRLILGDAAHPLTAGLAGQEFGAPAAYRSGPLPRVEDPAAEVLGRYLDDGPAALSVRRYPGWTSIYLAAPVASPRFLRNLCRLAGMHCYLETNDALYAANGLLGIHTFHAGAKTIHLPEKATVTDLFTGKVVGRDIDRFTVSLPARATAAWRLDR